MNYSLVFQNVAQAWIDCQKYYCQRLFNKVGCANSKPCRLICPTLKCSETIYKKITVYTPSTAAIMELSNSQSRSIFEVAFKWHKIYKYTITSEYGARGLFIQLISASHLYDPNIVSRNSSQHNPMSMFMGTVPLNPPCPSMLRLYLLPSQFYTHVCMYVTRAPLTTLLIKTRPNTNNNWITQRKNLIKVGKDLREQWRRIIKPKANIIWHFSRLILKKQCVRVVYIGGWKEGLIKGCITFLSSSTLISTKKYIR